jgi:putative FmdB family regulatory protein
VPLYEFRCSCCGPFDLHRTMQEDSSIAHCPGCAEPAQRRYSVGAQPVPNGALREAGRVERSRVDRARGGEPVVTGPPLGRRLHGLGGHHH